MSGMKKFNINDGNLDFAVPATGSDKLSHPLACRTDNVLEDAMHSVDTARSVCIDPRSGALVSGLKRSNVNVSGTSLAQLGIDEAASECQKLCTVITFPAWVESKATSISPA